MLPAMDENCPAWKTWADVFGGNAIIEYVSYTVIALLLAFVSCLLTIYLTNSATFVTRKESGVLFTRIPGPNQRIN
ncbi:hypothetical protein VKT23_000939 [Stygiomarasmius scandens]|uniref:Uncharacterized protein n=1 Tax=Marasmiellus scandens TaxID=2682957 RepID=A0ABR1K9F1_9AGAR